MFILCSSIAIILVWEVLKRALCVCVHVCVHVCVCVCVCACVCVGWGGGGGSLLCSVDNTSAFQSQHFLDLIMQAKYITCTY